MPATDRLYYQDSRLLEFDARVISLSELDDGQIAVTLALLFGLFALIYGVSQITMGVELRRTGKTLNSVRADVTA